MAVRFFPDKAAFHGNRYVRTILSRFLTMQPANGSRRGLVLPPQPDRGDEFVAAIIARPGVADAAFEIELGLFGHKQHTPAVRAVGSAEIFSRGAERGFPAQQADWMVIVDLLDAPPPVPDVTR